MLFIECKQSLLKTKNKYRLYIMLALYLLLAYKYLCAYNGYAENLKQITIDDSGKLIYV